MLVALTLLPVAVLVVSAHSAAQPSLATVHPYALHPEDLEIPSVDAFQRSADSSLFAPFVWNGESASGPFVSFGFSPRTGTISGYSSVNGSTSEVLVPSIAVSGFVGNATPLLAGPTFTAMGGGVTIVAHQEPMALLEIETATAPREVVFSFAAGSTTLAMSNATTWPRYSLFFALGDTLGSVIVRKGTMHVNGSTVIAALASNDYLALRAVPAFIADRVPRTAILSAFASGRLAAEYDLVAMTNGGWLGNAAQYQPNVTLTGDSVDFERAALSMEGASSKDLLVLVAFDPRTMPADAGHRVSVTDNGKPLAQAQDPLASLYASGGPATFSVLPMHATVLLIDLPSAGSFSLEVQSIAVPSGGIDAPTQVAMVAAVFIVSLAAAAMFRPRRE